MPRLEELTEQVESVIAQLQQPGVYEVFKAYEGEERTRADQERRLRLMPFVGAGNTDLPILLGENRRDVIEAYFFNIERIDNLLRAAQSLFLPRVDPRSVLEAFRECKTTVNSHFLYILRHNLNTVQSLQKHLTAGTTIDEIVNNRLLLDKVTRERFPTAADYRNHVQLQLKSQRHVHACITKAYEALGASSFVVSQNLPSSNSLELYANAALDINQQECNRIYGAQPQT